MSAVQPKVPGAVGEADPEEIAETDRRLEELLEQVGAPAAEVALAAPAAASSASLAGVAMRTALPLAVSGRRVLIRCRGVGAELEAELAPGVSAEVVALAAKNGDAVVVECEAGAAPLVVGVLQTRVPEEVVVRARRVHLEAEDELMLRTGSAAMRLRRDGDVELVGSRIAAMSRGLFRLVGRVLRLN
jgi:hypothetical protein